MSTNPSINEAIDADQKFTLSVYACEKCPNAYFLQPFGSLEAFTYKILEKKINLILDSKPEVVIFEMNHVNYINSRGLRVLLRTIKEMHLGGNKVYLVNLQPQIKEVFDLIGVFTPEQFLECRQDIEILLESLGSSLVGYTQWAKTESVLT